MMPMVTQLAIGDLPTTLSAILRRSGTGRGIPLCLRHRQQEVGGRSKWLKIEEKVEEEAWLETARARAPCQTSTRTSRASRTNRTKGANGNGSGIFWHEESSISRARFAIFPDGNSTEQLWLFVVSDS